MEMHNTPGAWLALLKTGIYALGSCGLLASPAFAERVISVKDDVVILLDSPRDREYTGSSTPVFRCTARQGDEASGEVIVTRTFTPTFEFPSGFAVRSPQPWRVSAPRSATGPDAAMQTLVAFRLNPGNGRETKKHVSVPLDGVVKTLSFGLDLIEWQTLPQAQTLTVRAFAMDVDGGHLELEFAVNGTQIDAGLRACHAKAVATGGRPL